jgi:hypothetical protein
VVDSTTVAWTANGQQILFRSQKVHRLLRRRWTKSRYFSMQ